MDIGEAEYIDHNTLSLTEWIELILDMPEGKKFIFYTFPTDSLRQEYLASINERSDDEILSVIEQFLLHSGSLGGDKWVLESFIRQVKEGKSIEELLKNPFLKRLLRWTFDKEKPPPWEGITWILELLPYYPRKALDAIDAYLKAHFHVIPDGRWDGLLDAASIIRAKFIGIPSTSSDMLDLLSDLESRDFEHLVEQLYCRMDYRSTLTPRSNDQGRDIIAKKERLGQREKLAVECKLHAKPIGVRYVRQLQGVINHERFTKGVIVTNNSFTRGARRLASEDSRIELITGAEFAVLMNEFWGTNWPLHIERIIDFSRRANEKRVDSNEAA